MSSIKVIFYFILYFRLASIVYDPSGQMQEVEEVIVAEQSENSDVSEDELNLLLNLYYFK